MRFHRTTNQQIEINTRWFKAKFSSLRIKKDRPEVHYVYTSARDEKHAHDIFKAASLGFFFKMKEIKYDDLIEELS